MQLYTLGRQLGEGQGALSANAGRSEACARTYAPTHLLVSVLLCQSLGEARWVAFVLLHMGRLKKSRLCFLCLILFWIQPVLFLPSFLGKSPV